MCKVTGAQFERAMNSIILSVVSRPDPTKDQGSEWIAEEIYKTSEYFKQFPGIRLKLASDLRIYGYNLIDCVKNHKVVADLKLSGELSELIVDAKVLRAKGADILTVMCGIGPIKTEAIKKVLEGSTTKLYGVTIPGDVSNETYEKGHKRSIGRATADLVHRVAPHLHGIICPSTENEFVKDSLVNEEFERIILCATNMRPSYLSVANDTQNAERSSSFPKAISAKSREYMIGRPIMQAKDPRMALTLIISEVAKYPPRV